MGHVILRIEVRCEEASAQLDSTVANDLARDRGLKSGSEVPHLRSILSFSLMAGMSTLSPGMFTPGLRRMGGRLRI